MTNPRLKVPPVSSPVIERRPATEGDRELLFELFRSALAPEDTFQALPESKREPLLRATFDTREQRYRKNYPLADFDVLTVDGKPAGKLYIDRGDDEFVLIEEGTMSDGLYRHGGYRTPRGRSRPARAARPHAGATS